jgi:hypothetical protein
MRNAGDGTPGGPSGRRQRAAESSAAARPAGNGGASLFTPAYRVRHPATVPGGGQTATQRDGSGYGYDAWPQEGQSASPYQESGYSDGGSGYDSELSGGGYSWMTDDSDGSGWPLASFSGLGSAGRGVSNAIRGLPPVPDEPLPSYPPGPFAAWNRGADSGAGSGSERDSGSGARDGSLRAPLAAATITPDEFDTDYSLPAIKDPVLPGSSRDGRAADRRAAEGRAADGSRAGRERAAAAQSPAADDGSGRSGSGRSHGSRRGAASGRRGRGRGKAAEAPRRAAGAGAPRRAAEAPARSGRAKPKSKSKHQPVVLAIGTAVVIIAAVTVVLVVTSLGKGQTSSSKPRAVSKPHPTAGSTPTAPAGKWGFIGVRSTDQTSLTLHELFPASFITGGVYFHVAKMQPGHDCHTALIGASLQAAVRKADCIQDMRASYIARLDNAMATIGVYNLSSAAAASKAALKTGPSEFVAQLPSKNGVSSKIGQGTGLEEAFVKGHYLILIWGEKIDLTAPRTAWQRGRLTRFMNTLLQDTVNSPLSFRQVYGKPQIPTHALPSPSSSPAA